MQKSIENRPKITVGQRTAVFCFVFVFKSEAAVTVRPKSVSCSNRSHKNELLNKFTSQSHDICHLKGERYFLSYLLRFGTLN